MDLYVKKDCKGCDELKQWLEIENTKNINILETEQKDDGKYYLGERMSPVSNFPALLLGEVDQKQNFLFGKEGIQSYLSKGFLHDVKTCPFMHTDCIEKKCEKFAILLKGLVPEGACSDYWTPILLIETMDVLKRQGK
jgi:hypothetical protein